MKNQIDVMQLIGGSELWLLRKRTAIEITFHMNAAGLKMAQHKDVDSKREKSIQTMGSLLQMCGELGLASAKMLSGSEHYAGAALLRQIVEIEYLTWTFEKGKSDIHSWLGASDKDRIRFFSPAQLRKNSKGRFLQADYSKHCEMGGHPVPKGVPLLGGRSVVQAQQFLIDLLLHCWRTWDQVNAWSKANGYDLSEAIKDISGRLNQWGDKDPAYKYMCSVTPEYDPDRKP